MACGSSEKSAIKGVLGLRARARASMVRRSASRGRRIRVAKANGSSWHSVPMGAMAMCVDLVARANANVPTMPNSNVVLAHGRLRRRARWDVVRHRVEYVKMAR